MCKGQTTNASVATLNSIYVTTLKMSQSANSKVTTTATVSAPRYGESIIIRPARLTEGYKLGAMAARTYDNTPMTRFLEPHRSKYPKDYVRGYQQRAQARMLKPENYTIVACEASDPSRLVGYGQFVRLGDDEGARRQIASRKSILLTVLNFLFWVYTSIATLLLPNRSGDPAAIAELLRVVDAEGKLHWDKPGRKNRWYAQSVVVLEEYQGKGIGKRLMREIIARAEAENVVFGLEASGPGKLMYLSVGFEFLASYQKEILGPDEGGVMMYTPKGLRDEQKM